MDLMEPSKGIRISANEQLALFERWKQYGDRDAYDDLARSLMFYARQLAVKFCRYVGTRDYDGAEAAAFVAISTTIRNWEPQHGKLSTYFTFAAKSEMERWYAERGAIRVPEHDAERQEKFKHRIRRARNTTSIRTRNEVDDWQDNEPAVIDDPSDTLEDDEQRRLWAGHVDEAMSMLTDREADIVRRTVLDGDTLEDVGEQLGITRERVRQIQANALEDVKVWINRHWGSRKRGQLVLAGSPPSPLRKESSMESTLSGQAGEGLLDVIGRLNQGELEREIRTLTDQRNSMSAQYDDKISRLTNLRNALFGKPKQAARRAAKAVVPGVPREGSQTHQIWQCLRENGPLHHAEVAVRLNLDGGKVVSTLSANTGKYFERTGAGVYAALNADSAAPENAA